MRRSYCNLSCAEWVEGFDIFCAFQCMQVPRSPPPGNMLPDAGHLAPHTHATPQTVQGTDLMRFAAAGDASLLIGGDLIVTVCQVSICYCMHLSLAMCSVQHATVLCDLADMLQHGETYLHFLYWPS